jgi:predicted CoA-binding protein
MSEVTHRVRSLKEGGPSFDIISYNPATKKGKLLGNYGVKFETDLSVETLKKLGYKVVPVQPKQV